MERTRLLRIAKHWDAGDLSCGQFIVDVRNQLGEMRAGELLELSTRNAGAPLDLPAWCQLAGHDLVAANHPVYVIRKSDR
jgi:tRNA 2-thiouridine synthesizing protein A